MLRPIQRWCSAQMAKPNLHVPVPVERNKSPRKSFSRETLWHSPHLAVSHRPCSQFAKGCTERKTTNKHFSQKPAKMSSPSVRYERDHSSTKNAHKINIKIIIIFIITIYTYISPLFIPNGCCGEWSRLSSFLPLFLACSSEPMHHHQHPTTTTTTTRWIIGIIDQLFYVRSEQVNLFIPRTVKTSTTTTTTTTNGIEFEFLH